MAEEELGDEQLQQIYDEQILQFTTIEALHILVDTEAEADDVYQQVTAPGATQADVRGPREGGVDRHRLGRATAAASARRSPRPTCRSSARPRSRSSPARSPSRCRASSAGT